MKTTLVLTMALCATAFAETKVKRADLPAPVLMALDDITRGAKIVGYSKEVENGKTSYEVEMKVGSMSKDVTLDANGKVVSVEQEIALADVPGPALDGLKRAAGKGRITKIESITKGTDVAYEAQLKGAPKKEVMVNASGALVNP